MNLLLRTDASVTMGTGHVMRCLALAQAWQDDGHKAMFALAEPPPALEERLRAEGMEVARMAVAPGSLEDAQQVAGLARRLSAAWVVVDGYQFGFEYQRALKDADLHLLVMDDYGSAGHYCTDLVLDQNLGAEEGVYRRRESHTRLLLGPRYILLRREFKAWRGGNREIPPVGRRVLVTLGGSDPNNMTRGIIQALLRVRVEGFEATVVVGGSNPHLGSLEEVVPRRGGAVRLLRDVAHMPELMARSDMAIIAAGGTMWELLYMGCPVLSYARNPVHAQVISQLQRMNAARDLGHTSAFNERSLAEAVEELAASRACRRQMAEAGRRVVDGLGAARVLQALAHEGGLR